MKTIKLLIVDDSEIVRLILRQELEKDPQISVVAMASNSHEARRYLDSHSPDIMTLDIEMPGQNGIEFLKKSPGLEIPVIIVSSYTPKGSHLALEALESGAADIVPKPAEKGKKGVLRMIGELRLKIKSLAKCTPKQLPSPGSAPQASTVTFTSHFNRILAIGASAGGTQAIDKLLSMLPADTPPIIIVQHMPENFTRMFAERLNKKCRMRVKEAENGDLLQRGLCLIAPGGSKQFYISKNSPFKVRLHEEEKVDGHCPSVTVMFQSVAKAVGKNSVGVILTGMGKDGASGMKQLRDTGAVTIAQSEKSAFIYGMPKAAVLAGGVSMSVDLEKIPEVLADLYK